MHQQNLTKTVSRRRASCAPESDSDGRGAHHGGGGLGAQSAGAAAGAAGWDRRTGKAQLGASRRNVQFAMGNETLLGTENTRLQWPPRRPGPATYARTRARTHTHKHTNTHTHTRARARADTLLDSGSCSSLVGPRRRDRSGPACGPGPPGSDSEFGWAPLLARMARATGRTANWHTRGMLCPDACLHSLGRASGRGGWQVYTVTAEYHRRLRPRVAAGAAPTAAGRTCSFLPSQASGSQNSR